MDLVGLKIVHRTKYNNEITGVYSEVEDLLRSKLEIKSELWIKIYVYEK